MGGIKDDLKCLVALVLVLIMVITSHLCLVNSVCLNAFDSVTLEWVLEPEQRKQ